MIAFDLGQLFTCRGIDGSTRELLVAAVDQAAAEIAQIMKNLGNQNEVLQEVVDASSKNQQPAQQESIEQIAEQDETEIHELESVETHHHPQQ